MYPDFPLRKIMVATDGSETSLRAAWAAISMARLAGGSVVVLFVADTARLVQISGYLMFPVLSEGIREGMLRAGQAATEEVEAMATEAGIRIEKLVVEGNPSDEILRQSLERDVDLLVMGSVGKGGLDRFILGSVAQKVVEHSKVPVMLVPGGQAPKAVQAQGKPVPAADQALPS